MTQRPDHADLPWRYSGAAQLTQSLKEPRRARCAATTGTKRPAHGHAPGWDDMSDQDKSVALMHVAKRDHEGSDEYVIEHHSRPATPAVPALPS